MSDTATTLARAASISSRLIVFRDLLGDALGQAFVRLSAACAVELPTADRLDPAYADFLGQLVAWASDREVVVPDAWQDYLLDQVVFASNAFTLRAQRDSSSALSEGLAVAARHDLDLIQQLFALDSERVRTALGSDGVAPSLLAVDWRALAPGRAGDRPDANVKRALAAAGRWSDALDLLARHLRQHGAGPLARFRAVRWQHEGEHGRLVGVPRPDPIRLDQLVGYEHQRGTLQRNTEQLVAGLPANNVLLYGDRGTGKSSLVKAMANAYGSQGLRLVELPKQHLSDFPALLAALADRPERFIVFLDDLSFEEHETHYKDLKALLEGSVEARPANVVLYATSNRRHLVREHYRDRKVQFTPDDEIQPQDTTQEKLSLADRFGIVLVFRAPDREHYLEIARSLAADAQLALPTDEIEQRALRWAVWHGGQTGRSARQFVDQLSGELALERLQQTGDPPPG